MTVDVEALLNESGGRKIRCNVCIWLDGRPQEEREKWEVALTAKKVYSAPQIGRAMAKVNDTAPTAGSIMNHRNGHSRGEGRGR